MNAGSQVKSDIHLRPKLGPKLSVYVWLIGRLVKLRDFKYNCPASSFFPSISVRVGDAKPTQTTTIVSSQPINTVPPGYMSIDQALTPIAY